MSVAVMERSSVIQQSRNYKINYNIPTSISVNRGEVWMVELDGVGSEQTGIRPCCIISNWKGNTFGTTVIVAAITSQIQKAKLPTHVVVSASESGLEKDSVIMLEQVRTVDKRRLLDKVTKLND